MTYDPTNPGSIASPAQAVATIWNVSPCVMIAIGQPEDAQHLWAMVIVYTVGTLYAAWCQRNQAHGGLRRRRASGRRR
ncbi:hypothetical protein [Streptomyces sp. NPDC018045]|uniref:hypothetical protein n=1 Tax=Streptomyces sp. NPDC018045 TaxID=3365037 RepID=UPI0037A97A84